MRICHFGIFQVELLAMQRLILITLQLGKLEAILSKMRKMITANGNAANDYKIEKVVNSGGNATVRSISISREDFSRMVGNFKLLP